MNKKNAEIIDFNKKKDEIEKDEITEGIDNIVFAVIDNCFVEHYDLEAAKDFLMKTLIVDMEDTFFGRITMNCVLEQIGIRGYKDEEKWLREKLKPFIYDREKESPFRCW